MTENQFDELLKAAIQEYGGEYIEIPEEMRKPHHFSRSFERRMQKLIRQAGIQVKHRRLPLRQLIAIIIAAVMVLSAAAMSVSAVRDVIIGFITEVYETFTGVRAEPSEDAPKTLEEIYEVTWVPEGYELVSNDCDIGMCSQLYVNRRTGNKIIFNQNIALCSEGNYDNEKILAEMTLVTVNDCQGLMLERNDGYEITWTDGAYVFKITAIMFEDDIHKSGVETIANSVRNVEFAEGGY